MSPRALSPAAARVAGLATIAAVASASAPALAQSYRFPVSDAHYQYFYPTAYKDHGGVDWACGDLRYDGHQGSDFGGGSWEGMAEGRDIVAAAPGLVVETHDGEADDCTTGDCAGGTYGNYVLVRHPDGKSTLYGHMKKGSVAVAPGQPVACADHLGQMGSSGHSTGPHLHFGVKTIDGNWADPFWGDCDAPPSYWVDQGEHGGLPSKDCGPPPPPCEPTSLLTCGAAVDARNDAAGSTNEHGHYGCGLELVYSGPEIAWSFVTDLDEPVTVALTGLSGDLSLHVLASETCDGSDCLGYSDEPGTGDEAVTFQATAGKKYVVVADGYQGAASDFQLVIACSGTYPAPGEGGAGGGTATGSGGAAGAGGAATAGATGGAGGVDAGGGAAASDGPASNGEGCACRAARRDEGGASAAAAALLLAGAAIARRRRRSAP